MRLVIVAFALVSTLGFAAQKQPRKKTGAATATDHRVKFDNELVRVILAESKPGPKGRLHKHDVNRVMVYLDDGGQRLEFADGTVKDQSWKAGDVFFDEAGGMHTSQNNSGKTFRIAEIELKKPGGVPWTPGALDPVKVAPGRYKVLLENDQVRVVRVRFAAGDMAPLHEHILPRVVIFLNDYHLRATAEDGSVTELKGEGGEIAMPGPARHSEKNMRGRLTEIIAVEIKAR